MKMMRQQQQRARSKGMRMMRRSLVGSSGNDGRSTVGVVQVPLTRRPVHERHTTVELEELDMLQLLQPNPAFAEQS